MSDKLSLEIKIPTDSDGFVLLQCPLCGEFFKLAACDVEAEDVFEIWCPNCGLKSKSYITDEIRDLALRMCTNKVGDMLFQHLKGAFLHPESRPPDSSYAEEAVLFRFPNLLPVL